MSETSFIGLKWSTNSNFDGDVFKQNFLIERFSENLKIDSKKFIDENTPQLIFQPNRNR